MSLPAAHLQSVQAAVKMANAPDLSLRGPNGAVAISGRHLQPVQAAVKTVCAEVWGVAAVTAQPLAALPPYGCGVPLAGSERHADWQFLRYAFCGARPPDLSLRGGRRPTWRPEREARGSALGVQSREGSCSSYKLSLKWCAPIASVAALTAQPLAALPPYGCGVPLAGCERLAGWQSLRHAFCGARLSDLSLRGRYAPVAISQHNGR